MTGPTGKRDGGRLESGEDSGREEEGEREKVAGGIEITGRGRGEGGRGRKEMGAGRRGGKGKRGEEGGRQVASSSHENLISKTLGASEGHFSQVIMVCSKEERRHLLLAQVVTRVT